MITVPRLVAVGVLVLTAGSGAWWWAADGEPDASRAHRTSDPTEGVGRPLAALLQRATNAQADDDRVHDAGAGAQKVGPLPGVPPETPAVATPALLGAATGGIGEPAYDPMQPDPRQRRHALERWARTLDASPDVAAMAMLDPDESIRERAQQLFEARLVSSR